MSTAPALLSILQSAARKPANRLLLDKGRQAYALIKDSILGSGTSVSGSCEIGPDVLLCRLVDASVALWRLR